LITFGAAKAAETAMNANNTTSSPATVFFSQITPPSLAAGMWEIGPPLYESSVYKHHRCLSNAN
jgi:hypothetical protein